MNGKRIAITGGFGALGSVTALLALEKGARVAVIGRDEREPPDPRIVVAAADLTDMDASRAAFAKIGEALGGLDGLANIAGGFVWEKTTASGGLDAWDRMYAINLGTAVAATKAALPLITASPAGRIVNVGAIAALDGGVGMGPYAASKAGVMRFTESLARELKSTSVTVNAVLPSTIDTPANRAAMGDKDAHKWVAPEALAEVILFLMSDAARAVTGALVPVAGRV